MGIRLRQGAPKTKGNSRDQASISYYIQGSATNRRRAGRADGARYRGRHDRYAGSSPCCNTSGSRYSEYRIRLGTSVAPASARVNQQSEFERSQRPGGTASAQGVGRLDKRKGRRRTGALVLRLGGVPPGLPGPLRRTPSDLVSGAASQVFRGRDKPGWRTTGGVLSQALPFACCL